MLSLPLTVVCLHSEVYSYTPKATEIPHYLPEIRHVTERANVEYLLYQLYYPVPIVLIRPLQTGMTPRNAAVQASLDRTVRLWDARNLGAGTGSDGVGGMKPLAVLPHSLSVNSAHFSPGGEWVATVAQNDIIGLYEDLAQASGSQVRKSTLRTSRGRSITYDTALLCRDFLLSLLRYSGTLLFFFSRDPLGG